MLIFEELINHFLGRFLCDLIDEPSYLALLQLYYRLQRFLDRKVGAGTYEFPHNGIISVRDFSIRVRILLGEFRYGFTGLIHIRIDAQAPPVRQWHRHHQWRMDKFHPESFLKFKVLKDGGAIHHGMVDRMGIVKKTWKRHLLGREAPAELKSLFQQKNFKSS